MNRLAITGLPMMNNAPRLDCGAFAFPPGGHNGRPDNSPIVP
jgi:hypothetical protein